MRSTAFSICLWLVTVPAVATVELNQAPADDLIAFRGMGPVMVQRVLKARGQQPFAHWPDAMQRLKGLGPRLAQRWSAEGLRIQGQAYPEAHMAPHPTPHCPTLRWCPSPWAAPLPPLWSAPTR